MLLLQLLLSLALRVLHVIPLLEQVGLAVGAHGLRRLLDGLDALVLEVRRLPLPLEKKKSKIMVKGTGKAVKVSLQAKRNMCYAIDGGVSLMDGHTNNNNDMVALVPHRA